MALELFRSALVACILATPALVAGGCAQQPADLPEAKVPPCEGRSCGDPCVACPAGDPAGCGPSPVVRQCDAEGQCMPAPVECGGQ